MRFGDNEMSRSVYVFILMIALLLVYVTVYFSIEIVTRTDMSLQTKSIWQMFNMAVPALGNVAYAIFGDRDSATFPA